MRYSLAIILTLGVLMQTGEARAWDSDCGGCGGETTYRQPWISGGHDEHRRWLEQMFDLAGVEARHRAFSLRIPRGGDSLGVVPDFSELDRLEQVDKTVAEFAQLPDMGYSLGDWVMQFKGCPPSPGVDGASCHKFAGYMGVLNSNHFLPQSELWYSEYHALARWRARSCAELKSTLEVGERFDQFREFSDECVQEALTLEAIAQHFLQDAWSSGHMWERWGGSSLDVFPGENPDLKLVSGLIVAMTAGIIHGTEPLTDVVRDPLCAPDPRVKYISDRGANLAVGDRHRPDVLGDARYLTQREQLLSCATASVAEIYQEAGQSANGQGGMDPSGCFAQRVTNLALWMGFLELPALSPGLIVFLTEVKLRLLLSFEQRTELTEALQSDIRRMNRTLASAIVANVEGTDVARGGLGTLLGVAPNGQHLALPPYKDPPVWSPTAEAPTESAIPRAFHRAHVREWCDVGTEDYLEGLRSRASQGGDAMQACTEIVRRHIELTEAIEVPPRDFCPGEQPPPPGGEEDPKVSLCQLLATGGHAIGVPVNYYEPPITDVFQLAGKWCDGDSFDDPPPPVENPTCPDLDPPPGGLSGPDTGASRGDPHMRTMDGLAYDFQAQGEFVLVRSTVDDLEIQARQQPSGAQGPCAGTAWNSALALRVGGQRVTFDANQRDVLHVGGVAVDLAEGERMSVGDGIVERLAQSSLAEATWRVWWADGSRARVELAHAYLGALRLNLAVTLATARAGNVEGPLGNFNGNPSDDLTLADGSVVGTSTADGLQTDDTLLYGAFADRWRVTVDTTLMDYFTGDSTADYQRPGLPTEQVALSLFPAEALEAAQVDCTAAGVTDAHWQEACVLDLLCATDSSTTERAKIAGGFSLQSVPTLRLGVVDTNPGGGGPENPIPPGNVQPDNQAGDCTATCDTDADCYIHGVADAAYSCDEASHRCVPTVGIFTCSRDLQCKIAFQSGRSCRAEADCPAGNVCGISYQGQRFGSQGRCLMIADQRQCEQRMTVTTASGLTVDVCGRPNATCVNGNCPACVADSDCGGSRPYCMQGWCQACRTNLDCGVNTCRAGSCVCTQDADCPGVDGRRHCDVATGACGCGSDGECHGFGQQWDSEEALCL